MHSLRDWLTRKQRETRRGRAELRLAERAALWETKPENRYLPSVFEWARIRALTHRKDWTETQRRMMRRASLVQARNAAVALCLFIGIAAVGVAIRHRLDEEKREARTVDLVQSLANADTVHVLDIVRKMHEYRRWIDPELRRMVEDPAVDPVVKIHARLALLPVDPAQVPFLAARLLEAGPPENLVLREALVAHRSALIPQLWSALESAKPGDPRVLPAASALAAYDPENSRWTDLGIKPADDLVKLDPVSLVAWLDALRPVRSRLTPSLATIFEQQRVESEHAVAAEILARYAADEPQRLAGLMLVADPKSFRRFFPVVEPRAAEAIPVFQSELAPRLSTAENAALPEPEKDRRAERQARAAAALLRLGRAEEIWPLLRHSADPRLRSFIINWLARLGADPMTIAGALESTSRAAVEPAVRPEPGAALDPFASRILFDPETSTRRALILALGAFAPDDLPAAERTRLTDDLLRLYRDDPDAGIHGAAEWILRRWKQQETLKAADADLSRLKDRANRRWYVNGLGQTFAVIEGPLGFQLGSPLSEPGRGPDLRVDARRLDYSYAIAVKEVNVTSFLKSLDPARDYTDRRIVDLRRYKESSFADGPMLAVTWYGAVAYCNWLSAQEGIPEDQWCYQPNDKGQYAAGMKIKANAVLLRGYRLPTEAEWEYACRAGAVTGRPYGWSTALLEKYAWYLTNSHEHAQPCGSLCPNDLGLFDMLGNVNEWCQKPEWANFDQHRKESELPTYERIADSTNRCYRGASFDNYQLPLFRSANRADAPPTVNAKVLGFRLVRTDR